MGPGLAVLGDHFDQVVKLVGIEVDTEWEVTETAADSRIKIDGRSKSNGRASTVETVAAHDGGSLVRLEADYDPPPGLLGEISDKLLFEKGHEEQAEQILARLKALCENVTAT